MPRLSSSQNQVAREQFSDWRPAGLLEGTGEIRDRLRRHDWSANVLGQPEVWPQSLRLSLSFCLNNRFPMAIWWGPDLIFLYNDSYIPILGKRHPGALGAPAKTVWADVWDVAVAPQLAAVQRGESSWNERVLLPTSRNGMTEDAWFTWSFSPILGESGRIAGAFLTVMEETQHVLHERELIETRDRLALTLSAAEIGYWSLDALTGRVVADANLAKAFSISREAAANGAPLQVFTDSIHAEDRAGTIAAITAALENGNTFEAEYRMAPREGRVRWVIARGRVTRNETGQATNMSGVLIDITDRMRSEQLVAVQNRVLQLVALESSLGRTLEEFVRAVESTSDDAIASILLVDDEGRFRHGAAPGLPADFNEAIDGLAIGENVGTCGRAAFLREVVITPDLAADPNWALLQVRATELGLKAAWSAPIIAQSGRVLGTFGTYFRQRREPTDAERKAVAFLVTTAAIAIERANEHEALKESEQRFRTLADNMSQFAWTGDEKGALNWYNRRWFEYTGTTLAEMQGWGWKMVHHPDHIDRVTAKWQESLAREETWEDTFPLRGKDGSYRWFLSRAMPIRNRDGKIVHWFGTNTDITEVRVVQQALAESEARFRNLLGGLPVACYTLDSDSRITFYNQAAIDLWGREPKRNEDLWCGSSRMRTLDGQPMPLGECPAAIAFRERRSVRGVEAIIIRPDGTERRVVPHPDPLFDAKGDFCGIINVIVDVTEQRAAEASLWESEATSRLKLQQHAQNLELRVAERTAKLQETVSELESFSYSISHDMRAPLRAMHSFAHFLREDCGDQISAEGKEYIRRIIASADRMDRLIQDVLMFSRISRAETPLEWVDLHALLAGILESYPQFDSASADVKIIGKISPVRGNRGALSQCLSNLIDNGIKFAAPGTRPEVTVWAEAQGPRVRIFIKDNGIGIAAGQLEKIFGIFYRIDQTKAGTGIGLSVVKKAVERMGGSVGVASEVGKGSTFYLDLERAETGGDAN